MFDPEYEFYLLVEEANDQNSEEVKPDNNDTDKESTEGDSNKKSKKRKHPKHPKGCKCEECKKKRRKRAKKVAIAVGALGSAAVGGQVNKARTLIRDGYDSTEHTMRDSTIASLTRDSNLRGIRSNKFRKFGSDMAIHDLRKRNKRRAQRRIKTQGKM